MGKELRKCSKAFYLSKSLSHFPKGGERGSIPTFIVTDLCDNCRPEPVKSQLFLIKAGLRPEGILGCHFTS